MNSGAATSTGAVDSVFLFITGASVFFLVLITFLMIFFIIKYNKKRHTKAKDIEGNTALEITWTIIPTIIVLLMFWFGWKGFEYLRKPPENSMKVKVTARMWSWMFEYENGAQTDELTVPVNIPVKLDLESKDVVHSFYIPAFRIKEDAVPGINNHLWFEANETGTYDILCAEYCGLRHAYMLSKVNVVEKDEYEKWYAQVGKEVEQPAPVKAVGNETETALIASGERLVKVKGCRACHSTDGSKLVGPSFKGLFGSRGVVIAAGREQEIAVDEKYLRASILKPNESIVKGFQALMPPQQLTEEELVAIIQYLKGL